MICKLLAWIFDPLNLTAISTAIIAVFTIVLALVSRRQSELIGESIVLARDEFNATHRPEISILTLEPTVEGVVEEKVAVQIMYVNKGKSPAKDIEIRCRITNRFLPLQTGIGFPDEDIITKNGFRTLAAGVKDHFLVESDIYIAAAILTQRGTKPTDNIARVVCIGRIDYKDGAGIRRETGFCRILDARTNNWETHDNPAYEYAY